MIRQATKYDTEQIIDMMRRFRDESPVRDIYQEDDPDYWRKLLAGIFAGAGVIFIAEGQGLLMAAIVPSFWSSKVLSLHEAAWYVLPEHRGGSVGFRLFRAYVEYGKALKAEGKIRFFTIGKMSSSPDLKFGKYGFRPIDETWIYDAEK